jgi:N-acetyl-anhydromuramyl-L-alanine amidase AmpD
MPVKQFFLLMLISFLHLSTIGGEKKSEIIERNVNFGIKKTTNRNVDVIIIHSVYNASGGEQYDVDLIIRQFARYKVCAHYLIDRDGNIIQLVNERNIAFHAGVSKLPDGSTGINSRSIGIEIVTSLTEKPAEIQIIAAAKLVRDIQSRHKIMYILRHSDIAPERKTDPWNMDWESFLSLIKEHE